MDSSYPRDMRGYGRTPPDPQWPGGAKACVQFVLNFEEGGENNVLHGDPYSEAFLSDIIGAENWPNERHWNMESMYEYGSRAGFWRLWRLFHGRKVPLTVFAVATAMQRAPDCVAAMTEAGWDLATHGLKWISYRDVPKDVERQHILDAIRLHTDLIGTPPTGFYQGRASINTVDLAAELGAFPYLSDTYADDLPYWRGDQLMIPYTLDANDMRFVTASGFANGGQFFDYLRDTFDALVAEGEAGAPKMMSVGLHCRLVGRPGRAIAVERFVDYVQGSGKAWIATRADVARHWRTHCPAP